MEITWARTRDNGVGSLICGELLTPGIGTGTSGSSDATEFVGVELNLRQPSSRDFKRLASR
jgi:hypothetical protein